MSGLFSPLVIGEVTLKNRIGMSPMCMYSCDGDGMATGFHVVHLGSRAAGGCSLVMTEATAVAPEGRISPEDLGLWNDAQTEALRPVVAEIKRNGAVSAIQLAHAGRKAGTYRPWSPKRGYLSEDEGGWERSAPSPVPFSDAAPTPTEMTPGEISDLIGAFQAATVRADQAGFEAVEIHAAHGYLLHQFLSPLSNHRTDGYGGSLENRARVVLEICAAIREVWPVGRPLFVRISATDWVEGGWTLEESIELSKMLKVAGVDLIDVSSGGSSPDAKITTGPEYQVPFADAIRRESGLLTGAVGMITTPASAEKIVTDGRADMVFLGRKLLHDPYWALHAAKELGVEATWPDQYGWAVKGL